MWNVYKVEKINILVLEGLAIFFVMLVHAGTPNYIYAFFSYGLGSLVFARGYQWKERNLTDIISSRVLLLQTYYVAGFINTLIFLLIAPSNVMNYPKRVYLTNFLIGRMDKLDQVAVNAIPVWFFLMLFFAEILFYFVEKSKFLLIFSIIGSFVFRIFAHEPLPFKIDAAIIALPFFWIGREWKKRNLSISIVDFMLATVGLILISQVNGDISWNNQWFGKSGIISFLGEVLAIVFIVFLSDLVKKLKIDKSFLRLSMNALFVISYHILLGSLIYVVLSFFGLVISDVMVFLNKFWYIYFTLDLILVYLAITYLPSKVKVLLIGDLRRLLSKR
jgi:acyltransferase